MIKEKIMGLLDVMSEEQAEKLYIYIQNTYELIQKETFDSIEEDEPTEEEIRVIQLYKSGDEEYQPYITHEELKKQFGIK
ncbi:hypothetical protein [Sedimentibacter sp.]|uniref:hypothetical protein n=1 Tax=Sedimentibacter sp. TaxID=1960295 RepID=UPI0028A04530|nr:hypothetical protein [Sedimentibacter sp.]